MLHGRTRNRGLAIHIMLTNVWGHSSKQKDAPKLPPPSSGKVVPDHHILLVKKEPHNVRMRRFNKAIRQRYENEQQKERKLRAKTGAIRSMLGI